MKAGSSYLKTERENYRQRATLRGSETSKAPSQPEMTPQNGSQGNKYLHLSLPSSSDSPTTGLPSHQVQREARGQGRGAPVMYPKYHFLGLRAGQSGGWIWGGGNWKVLNRVCEMGLEHGGWVGVRGD